MRGVRPYVPRVSAADAPVCRPQERFEQGEVGNQPNVGLVEKPYSQLCWVLVPSRRDCDLTRKCMSDKSDRSHVFAWANTKDLPQLHKRTLSTSPKHWGTEGQVYFTLLPDL